jgi:quinol-cytochrome oxidoreductase complex cytochrome b subunit
MRYSRKNSVLSLGDSFLRTHHAPSTISYMWNFGVYSLVFLFVQIITGLLLAMYYVPSPEQAFDSVENIMRDIKYGWLLRYMHSNGASFFFIAVYIHIFRGLYYTSFIDKKRTVWYIGAIILLLIILTAFLGYVLPWGQISYWGAIVITNFLSAVPVVGQSLVEWVWGGYSLNATTLTRFYGLHFLMPFIILLLSLVHLYYLHQAGHNNPVGTDSRIEPLSFFPYFISKDILGLWIFFSFYLFFVFFYPNLLGHPDNYIKANPLVTPAHIVPEWYFLPLYAILRSIPNKLGGVLLLLFAIVSILLLPLLFKTNLTSLSNRPLSRHLFFFFLFTCFFLGWIGGQPAQYPYTLLGAVATSFYFSYFYLFGPIFIYIENNFSKPDNDLFDFYKFKKLL